MQTIKIERLKEIEKLLKVTYKGIERKKSGSYIVLERLPPVELTEYEEVSYLLYGLEKINKTKYSKSVKESKSKYFLYHYCNRMEIQTKEYINRRTHTVVDIIEKCTRIKERYEFFFKLDNTLPQKKEVKTKRIKI